MECTLATPHQAVSHSFYIRSGRNRFLVPAAALSSERILSVSASLRTGDARRLAARTTVPIRRFFQLGAELLSCERLEELNLFPSSAWKTNAGTETIFSGNRTLINGGWPHLAVLTGWLLQPAQAVGEEAMLNGGSMVEDLVRSDAGTTTAELTSGVGSGLGLLDTAGGGAASADLVTASGAAEPTDFFDSVASSAVSLLFVLAFLGLLALTIGVVYLAVAEFREKKEAEKEKLARSPTKQVERLSEDVASGKGFGKKTEKVLKEKSRK